MNRFGKIALSCLILIAGGFFLLVFGAVYIGYKRRKAAVAKNVARKIRAAEAEILVKEEPSIKEEELETEQNMLMYAGAILEEEHQSGRISPKAKEIKHWVDDVNSRRRRTSRRLFDTG